ncbi:hypothetical protein [Ktedonobacter racemifer]|uniref:Uncharacterized protein n=1 Tax=Ktedonobacter racemifer DSM 44963 TaxID=485913 RepID=D6TCZ0_KTERA|nr:hypothetical protein [Ktedonobacter racemifer]EFH90041.1 hypothetical protein Krac_11638 [Ktedonobacter racemifer DSM 44963]
MLKHRALSPTSMIKEQDLAAISPGVRLLRCAADMVPAQFGDLLKSRALPENWRERIRRDMMAKAFAHTPTPETVERESEPEHRFSLISGSVLDRADGIIYAVVGACFLIGAICALCYSFWDFATNITAAIEAGRGDPALLAKAIIQFVSDLLLVLIIMEVLGPLPIISNPTRPRCAHFSLSASSLLPEAFSPSVPGSPSKALPFR